MCNLVAMLPLLQSNPALNDMQEDDQHAEQDDDDDGKEPKEEEEVVQPKRKRARRKSSEARARSAAAKPQAGKGSAAALLSAMVPASSAPSVRMHVLLQQMVTNRALLSKTLPGGGIGWIFFVRLLVRHV